MNIRARTPDDIEACVRLLADVHAADGYPVKWPANPVRRLTPDALLAAWVAEADGIIIGHVALCSAVGDPAAPLWCDATDLPAERIGVVARLFVAPSVRGQGVGAALLARVCDEARSRNLHPALEVLDHDRSAIALYERSGWLYIGSVSASWAQANKGQAATLRYYLAPV